MTSGPVWGQLVVFAIPILIGDIFQQLYNAADSAIVGTYVGTQALAAVGACTFGVRIIVGFFIGISVGCTVVVARTFGRGDFDQLKKEINIIVLGSTLLGIFLSILGIAGAPLMLRVMNVPEDVYDLALLYLRVFFGGMLGLVLYNTSTGILRAVGDSRHPLIFLIFSSLLNVVLDYGFVVYFGWGVAGVAIATTIAQTLSALLCLRLLWTSEDVFRWEFSPDIYDREVFRNIIHNGFPVAVQRVITQMANLIFVSYVSFFGSACLAGWTIYSKIGNFMLISAMSLSTSETTFISQNNGVGNKARIREGIWKTSVMACTVTVVLSGIILLFLDPIIRLFSKDPETLSYAAGFIRLLIWFTLAQTMLNVLSGALRGIEHSKAATNYMLAGLVVVRQIYLFCITKVHNTPTVVALGFPVGWTFSMVLILIHLVFFTDLYRKQPKVPG